MADLTWDDLDAMVESDPLALRDKAWAEMSRLRVQEQAARQLRIQAQEQRAELLTQVRDALGMAPTRDWDDVLNAARCLRKNATTTTGQAPDAVQDPCRESEGMTGIDCEAGDKGHPLPHRGWWRHETDVEGEYAVYIEWPVPDRPDALSSAAAPDVAELLERCDVEDRVAGEYGWIQTTEIRDLLGVPNPGSRMTMAESEDIWRTDDCTCSGTENPPLPAEMDPLCPLHGLAADHG